MAALIDVILPVFLILGFGWTVAWRGWFDEAAIDGLMRFAQSFAVPCLLFSAMSQLDLSGYSPGLMLSFYLGAFAGFGIGYAGGRLLFGRSVEDAIAIGFVCLFSNSLLLGLAITERAYGSAALNGNYAIISIHAPMLYAFGILVMEAARARRGGGAGQASAKALRSIATNPLLIGILLGLLVNASGWALPGPAAAALDMMTRAALPAALFGLGGVMFRYRPEGDMRAVGFVTLVSLVVHPAISYGLARLVFALDTAGLRSVVLTAAMAPGINAYLFANMYGAARRVAATSVLVATAMSILTIWLWLLILP